MPGVRRDSYYDVTREWGPDEAIHVAGVLVEQAGPEMEAFVTLRAAVEPVDRCRRGEPLGAAMRLPMRPWRRGQGREPTG